MVKRKLNFLKKMDTKVKIILAIGVVILSYVIAKLVSFSIIKVKDGKINDKIKSKLLMDFIAKVSTFIIVTIGLFIALKIVGFDLSTILVVIGSVGIGIALALKDFLTGCVNGIVIVYMNYYNIGDLIQVDDLIAIVKDFNLVNTIVEDIEGIKHIIPNTTMVSDRFSNLSKNEYAWTGAEACISNSDVNLDVKSLLDKFNKELVEMPENDKKVAYTFVEEMNKYGTVIGGGIDVKPDKFWDMRKMIRIKLRDFLTRNKVRLCGPLPRYPTGQS